jgi:ABC-type multidrug transport system permease subunit
MATVENSLSGWFGFSWVASDQVVISGLTVTRQERLAQGTMMSVIMKSTAGESIIALLISGVAALIAAVVGFVFAIYVCGKLLRGEMGEWALILAPVTAVVSAVAVFVIAFRKIDTYGENPDSP